MQIEGIVIRDPKTIAREQMHVSLKRLFSQYADMEYNLRMFIEEILSNGLDPNLIDSNFDYSSYIDMIDDEALNKTISYISHISNRSIEKVPEEDENRLEKEKQLLSNNLFGLKKMIVLLDTISKYKNIKVSDITENDFFETPINEVYFTTDFIFDIRIENLFYGYALKRFNNQNDYHKKRKNRDRNNSISDADFIKKFPPPWLEINNILLKHSLNLEIIDIKPEAFHLNYYLNISFINTTNGNKILFKDLSSGEKIIVGLIIRIFFTNRYTKELKFPDCIVLDEPDAYLHPEMTNLLLDVLYNTFMNLLGMKVIVTTHSPSTVALTPAESIFELKNGNNSSLKKISKDDALKILTGNLPLLSINYNNHKQIFVESPTDQYFYQTIFNKLKYDKKTYFNLYFISTGYGKSNCTQVIKIIKDLRNAGNETAFGIIDWDNINIPEKNVLVHGFEKRYSIENYIYDPIYLCILFIEQNLANDIKELGFNKSFNQYSIQEYDNTKLQELADWVIKKLIAKFPVLNTDELIEISYANNKRIAIPSWYLQMKGHDIETKLKGTFLSLGGFKNEGDLQKKLTEIMVKCYPLIPEDSFVIIKQLANR